MEDKQFDAVVVGAGLAGLTCALELTEKGYKTLVLEANHVVGGRTSSWVENGMHVESGFHRVIGYYKQYPAVLAKAGVDVNKIVNWEERMDVRSPIKERIATFGIAPLHGPVKMLQGILGNNDILSFSDKLSLLPFFVKGFWDYLNHPEELDKVSIHEYAKKHGVHDDAYHILLFPLTAGLFFLPPERYSAYVFFGLCFPAVTRFYKMRIGAYLGGMTEMTTKPIADAIETKGGTVRTGVKVDRLLYQDGIVTGVAFKQEEIKAKQTVVATELGAAKRILKQSGINHEGLAKMMKLPTMPAVTIQMELDKPLIPYDRTTFGAGTALVSFAEQSRTTFKHVPGRLSVILGPSDRFLDMKPEQVLEITIEEARKIGLDIKPHLKDYRIVSHPEDFHSLEPGHDWMRPDQSTPIRGLTLAGDYTRQPYFATMEGAVISGQRAAQIVLQYLH
ncbi:hydroxysqualene dehydroxylase [Sediminibacillus massiliensis]|uniref:hydroxysqualene dehydroxylase n=1 Tax=Sediminibacillus massiliensis TaxID=1926277 RepID=UPI0009886D10|nr:NAD(P)/FAD-dependent oxidoreductase [Sediminibacillus massiliensis]